ncbi:MAG: ComF family protein [Firmicutes bacterium]|nr:ComF family protein [Bacillota bacterium]
MTGLICPICEQHGSSPGKCSCLSNNYPFKGFAALCFYEKHWRDLLHDLKYRKKRSLARPLGAWLGREIDAQTNFNPTILTPIPLHKERKKERGFNQSELLARSAAKVLGIPCDNLLERTRNTPSQTLVSRRERRDNISGAFRCRKKIGKNDIVLLVDDIYSTGSTMKEAASVLKKQGATVFAAAVAYNRRHRF